MKTLRQLSRLLLLVGLLSPGLAAAADFVLIVNPANNAGAVSKVELKRYYLRTLTTWPGGEPVKPIDLPKGNPLRAAFAAGVMERSISALDQYWTQSIFSGRAVPPPEKKTDREVVEFVREHAGAVGYVSAGTSLDGVKKVTVTD